MPEVFASPHTFELRPEIPIPFRLSSVLLYYGESSKAQLAAILSFGADYMAKLFEYQAESLPSWWDGNFRNQDANLNLIRDDGAS